MPLELATLFTPARFFGGPTAALGGSTAPPQPSLFQTFAGPLPMHGWPYLGWNTPSPPPSHGSSSPAATVPTRMTPTAEHFYHVDLDDYTTTNLHAQAVAVLDIKAVMPITLDINSGNYTRWRGLLLVTLDKYALADHVLTYIYRPDHSDWMRRDSVVLF